MRRPFNLKICLLTIVGAGAVVLAKVSHASDTAYRCADVGGRITFSDVPCPRSAISQSVISTVPATRGAGGTELRQLRNMQAIRAMGERSAHGAAGSGASGSAAHVECPTERDITNLETRASSITLDARSRSFLQAEIRRAKACGTEGGRYSREDWARINAGISAQTRISGADRAMGQMDAERVHASAASPQERQRMQADLNQAADQESQSARLEAMRSRANASSASEPRTVTHCSGGNCWDDQGAMYRNAGGGQMYGPTGFCQKVGNSVQCP
ncbi:MAG: DUF4124 domain-containing protein [Zoogloea sp.]|nr:DUF4124 domain-containing protein [Zoogloea sp.]